MPGSAILGRSAKLAEDLQSASPISSEVALDQTSFTDSDGVLWSVREDGAGDARSLASDVSTGSTWLRFESDLEVRRLWHYPDDWRGLSPLQLESLLDRASTVIARFRPAPHRGVRGSAILDREASEPGDARPGAEQAEDVRNDPSNFGNRS